MSEKPERPNEEDVKTCFIISPFGNNSDSTWRHFKNVEEYYIKKALKEFKLEGIRSDEEPTTGSITKPIINRLRFSKLVIADITGLNPNVMYELALREAAQKAVIIIKDKNVRPKEKIPFDISRTRVFSYSLLHHELDASIDELKRVIRKLEETEYKADSPVTDAMMKISDERTTSEDVYLRNKIESIENMLRQHLAQSSSVPYTRGGIYASGKLIPNSGQVLTWDSVNTLQSTFLSPDIIKMKEIVRDLGIYTIERSPQSITAFVDVIGTPSNFGEFIDLVKSNLIKGVDLVNYDPIQHTHWLWKPDDISKWYYHQTLLYRAEAPKNHPTEF